MTIDGYVYIPTARSVLAAKKISNHTSKLILETGSTNAAIARSALSGSMISSDTPKFIAGSNHIRANVETASLDTMLSLVIDSEACVLVLLRES
jgi:hypothetical protein